MTVVFLILSLQANAIDIINVIRANQMRSIFKQHLKTFLCSRSHFFLIISENIDPPNLWVLFSLDLPIK